MENNLLQAQEKIEHVDYLCYMLNNSVGMMISVNDTPRVGMQEIVEGSMMTIGYLLDDVQKSIKDAIDLIIAERKRNELMSQKGGAA